MSLSLRPCRLCHRAFSPSRPEVRHCTRCADLKLGVRVVRVRSINEPSFSEWRPLWNGSYQRRVFAGAGAL